MPPSRLLPDGSATPRLAWFWLLRFPLLGAILLLALPLAARGQGWGLAVAGAFQLRFEEAVAVGALAMALAWSLTATVGLLLTAVPARFGLPPLGAAARQRWRHWQPWLRLVLILPTVVRVLTAAAPTARPLVGLGFVLGLALTATLGRLAARLRGAEDGDGKAVAGDEALQQEDASSRPVTAWGPGYRPRRTHLAAGAMLTLWSLGYLGIGLAFQPVLAPLGCRDFALRFCFPVLGYLLLTATTLAWLLPGLSFLLDHWRLPVLPALALVMLTPLLLFDPGHSFTLLPLPAPRTPAPSPPEALRAWLRPGPCQSAGVGQDPPPLVVVAAAGGGIKAALWTATVLGGLEERLGARFTGSLQAVSAVSGGSLGTVAYLAGLQRRDRPRDATQLRAIRRSLAGGSLRPAFWSLAYADLWRGPAAAAAWAGERWRQPGWAALTRADRAWALERSWAAGLEGMGVATEPTVLGWTAAVAGGCRATPLLNAMAVESGAPLVIAPLRLHAADAGDSLPQLPDQIDLGQINLRPINPAQIDPGAGAAPGGPTGAPAGQALAPGRSSPSFQALADFGEAYPAHDLSWLTAARLSASFPWITPAARAADAAGPVAGDARLGAFHSDGGYFDNYGIVTLVEYLGAVLPAYQQAGGRRVLLISVYSRDCPGPGCQDKQRQATAAVAPADLPGLRGLLAGPLSALINARGATQKVRNLQTLDLLVRRWSGAVDIQRLEFVLEEPLPLSWELTSDQSARLEAVWAAEAQAGAAAVGAFLDGR